jgi:hypothetical protein
VHARIVSASSKPVLGFSLDCQESHHLSCPSRDAAMLTKPRLGTNKYLNESILHRTRVESKPKQQRASLKIRVCRNQLHNEELQSVDDVEVRNEDLLRGSQPIAASNAT